MLAVRSSGGWKRDRGLCGRRRRLFHRQAGDIAIYICRDPVDFRMGINGLSMMVEATRKYDPFSRNLYCFVNKRKNQIKVLYWQRTGFCLWLKRLEEERFKWPFHLGAVEDGQGKKPPDVELDEEQFFWRSMVST